MYLSFIRGQKKKKPNYYLIGILRFNVIFKFNTWVIYLPCYAKLGSKVDFNYNFVNLVLNNNRR
jgi:hypothetical protein